jgi:hypothetical protein
MESSLGCGRDFEISEGTSKIQRLIISSGERLRS